MILEDRDGGVVTLTFNDPKRRNAFSMELRFDLLERLRRLEPDPTVRVIVLTGGADVFCVGGDVAAMGRQAVGPALERLPAGGAVVDIDTPEDLLALEAPKVP